MAAGQRAIDLDWPGWAGFFSELRAQGRRGLRIRRGAWVTSASAAAGPARDSSSVTQNCDMFVVALFVVVTN